MSHHESATEDLRELATALHIVWTKDGHDCDGACQKLAKELLPTLNERGWFLVGREELDGALSADGVPL